MRLGTAQEEWWVCLKGKTASNVAICKYLKACYLQEGLSSFCLSLKHRNPIGPQSESFRVLDFS